MKPGRVKITARRYRPIGAMTRGKIFLNSIKPQGILVRILAVLRNDTEGVGDDALWARSLFFDNFAAAARTRATADAVSPNLPKSPRTKKSLDACDWPGQHLRFHRLKTRQIEIASGKTNPFSPRIESFI